MRLSHNKQEKKYCLWDVLGRLRYKLRFIETGRVVQMFKQGQAYKETDERFGDIKPNYEVN
jgi:hypothetical protein